jgi:tetratricopeptide (TPR) repeat protein
LKRGPVFNWKINISLFPLSGFQTGSAFVLMGLSAINAPPQVDWAFHQKASSQLSHLIDKKAFPEAGKCLAQRPFLKKNEIRRILSLEGPALVQLYSGFQKAPSKNRIPQWIRMGTLLAGLQKRAHHDLRGSLQTLFPLFLEYPPWMVPLAGPLGKMAIQLSRRGNPSGLPILKKINEIWKGQAFASANLALAFRLLGKYSDADRLYAIATKEAKRAPWILNNWGLCKDAMQDREAALSLFLEGAHRGKKEGSQKNPGDSSTCLTNAALILEQRGRTGDLTRAISLLKTAVSLAPNRIRPRYYLHIFRIELSGEGQ